MIEQDTPTYDNDYKRQLLGKAVEQNLPHLTRGIQVYVRKLNLATERSEIESLAQEILQDTVIAALANPGNYDPARPAHSWLLGIAINHIRRRLRDQSPKRRNFITPVADTSQVRHVVQQSGSEALSEDEMFDLLYHSAGQSSSQDRPTLDDLLSLAGESDRNILELAFVGNLKGIDLAAKLGLSEGATRTRLSRAIARLRQAYLRDEQVVREEQ